MERKNVAENLKWRTTDVFPTDEAWEKEFKEVEKASKTYDFASFKGKLGDKESLLACLRLNDEISRRLEKLYLYAHLRHDEDVRVAKYNSAYAP